MYPREFLCGGKQQLKVRGTSLFCFWAMKELGMWLRGLAKRVKMSPSPSAVGSPTQSFQIPNDSGTCRVKMR
jgi:hypothetical protein